MYCVTRVCKDMPLLNNTLNSVGMSQDPQQHNALPVHLPSPPSRFTTHESKLV